MNRAILRSFVFENCTCKYNYPAVLLPLWLTHVPCAAVPLPSLSSYSTAVSNLIPRLFSPILSYPHEFLLPPNHQNTSSPPRRSVLFWALRHALSLVSSFKLPSAFPFSRRTTRCRSLFPPSRLLSPGPYSSRTNLAVFALIVAVLLNPLRIVCARAKDAAVVQRKLARGSKTHPRYPHPLPRNASVHLSAARSGFTAA